MGCCISAEKRDGSSMKLTLSMVAKAKKLVMTSEKRGRTAANGENKLVELAAKGNKGEPGISSEGSSVKHRSDGSKDEAFFDSVAWLESDCDDDYFSVRGDFTPSRGNSLNYHGSNTPGTPRPTLASIVSRMSDVKTEISPTSKKKKLADLFKETQEKDEDAGDVSLLLQISSSNQQKADHEQPNVDEAKALPPKALVPAPVRFDANSSSDSVPTTDLVDLKIGNSTAKGSQCCMPNMLPGLSFSEKKMLSSRVPMIENKAQVLLEGVRAQFSCEISTRFMELIVQQLELSNMYK